MAKEFRYTSDKRTRWLTIMWISIAIGIVVATFTLLRGTYVHAWLLSLLTAVIALYILSIPRRISVDEHNLEIQCIVELTRIDVRDIRSIRKVAPSELKYLFPILGSYGFFGYYGYYLNLRKWDMVKVYASEWSHFVEIVDIYEQTYIVSSGDADELIEAVMQVKLLRAGEKNKKSQNS